MDRCGRSAKFASTQVSWSDPMPDIYTAIKEDHDKHRVMIERIKLPMKE